MDGLLAFWAETGIAHFTAGQVLMMAVGVLLLYLAIVRGFEPLLLLPIGFGAVLANIPNAGFTQEGEYSTTPIMWGLKPVFFHY